MKFPDLLEQIHVPFLREGNEHCRPGWIQLDCPFCCDGHRWHLGYSLESNYLSCWKCGFHSTVELLVELTGKTFRECRGMLGGLEKERLPEIKHTGKLVIPKGVGPMLRAHRRYLREERRLDPDKMEALWGLQGIGIGTKLPWRLFIPIHYQGQVVSWTTRSLGDTGQRYISASSEEEAVPHKKLLYGEDYCRHAIIVHEGPGDVWATGPGAVATCGTSYSRGQVLRIAKYPVRAVCFDNEPEAQRRASALCDLLEPFPGETHLVVLDAKDSGEASRKEIRTLRRSFLD